MNPDMKGLRLYGIDGWRLSQEEETALVELASSRDVHPQEAMNDLLIVGQWLASAEVCETTGWERTPACARRIRTLTLEHARKTLADSLPAPHRLGRSALVPLEEHHAAVGMEQLADEDETSTTVPRVESDSRVIDLRAAATAPQEQLFLAAFEEPSVRTYGDVDRYYDWSHGHAATVASRLKKKAQRAA